MNVSLFLQNCSQLCVGWGAGTVLVSHLLVLWGRIGTTEESPIYISDLRGIPTWFR
jgi:hypothetical protein